jgi:hypothetical protein
MDAMIHDSGHITPETMESTMQAKVNAMLFFPGLDIIHTKIPIPDNTLKIV